MDDMDRMLRALPEEAPSSTLADTVRIVVHRRHRRRQVIRTGAASLLGLIGIWLAWPGVAWLSSGAMFASSASWLFGGLDYLNAGSAELLDRLLGGTFALQNAIGGSLAVSIWLGALVLAGAVFLAVDPSTWQFASASSIKGPGPSIAPSSIHVHS